ncbi:MAG: carbonic anhydrase [Acidimicrobiia bacterium]|nr:carbonic anhydrase [Acidimicrobiia bacterium]
MTADEALERLLEGNQRFASGSPVGPRRDPQRRNEQAEGQTPFAVILGCADSRVPPEILFDQGIGDLFSVRVAGNIAVEDVTLGSIEFGVAVLGCPLVMVLGHERCGAVKATVDAVVEHKEVQGTMSALVLPIVSAVEAVDATSPDELLDAAVKQNVHRQVGRLRDAFVDATVVGAEYNLHTGRVELVP